MKKFIAILMALAVCGTVAYTACAEEADEAEDIAVVAEAPDLEEVADVVDELIDDEQAMAKAEELKDALANDGDVVAVYNEIAKYVGDLTAAGSGRDALDKFLQDAGVNTEVLNDAISKSVVANAALDLYYKPEEETTVPTTPDEPTTTPEEEVSIPDTGYKF